MPAFFKSLLIPILLYCFSLNAWAVKQTQELQIKDKHITVELANTNSKRSLGLMYRTELADNHGMLFVFKQNDRHCFWMKNTLIPLSIAFIDQDNKIIDIQEMQAESLDSHCPPEKIGLALEMNAGWFEKNNINIGDVLYKN